LLTGKVVAVAKDSVHRFSKKLVSEIRIIDGLGVEGDAHLGGTVKHRSRVAIDPAQPNLRQVHLIHSELFEEVGAQGFVAQTTRHRISAQQRKRGEVMTPPLTQNSEMQFY
jgi:hypothetical protein